MNLPDKKFIQHMKFIQILEIALRESLKLQSHYAKLLNQYDYGERMTFESAHQWIERLRATGTLPKEGI